MKKAMLLFSSVFVAVSAASSDLSALFYRGWIGDYWFVDFIPEGILLVAAGVSGVLLVSLVMHVSGRLALIAFAFSFGHLALYFCFAFSRGPTRSGAILVSVLFLIWLSVSLVIGMCLLVWIFLLKSKQASSK